MLFCNFCEISVSSILPLMTTNNLRGLNDQEHCLKISSNKARHLLVPPVSMSTMNMR